MTKFTPSQQQAINERNHDILVSASAGSGKTTVLVERVLQEILSGIPVSQLLIVTFTKAAAEEMKNRIKQALTKALAENPTNPKYLQQQLTEVDTANISTIDAFCLDVIHRFYYVIDLDPSFSVLTDETQAALLKERALQDVESEYLERQDSRFVKFYDNFAGDRDIKVARNLLLDLYNFAIVKPDYRDWLKNLSSDYEATDSIVTTKLWQEQIKPYLISETTSLQTKLNSLLDNEIVNKSDLAKVNDVLTTFVKHLNNYAASLAQDAPYNDQRENLRLCIFDRMQISKKWDEDLQEFYQEVTTVKKEVKAQIFSLFTSFYASDEAEQLALLKKGGELVDIISEVELKLIDRFGQLKRAENLLDYSDMEQFAYQILGQDTSNSQLAREFYQNKFSEIMIDEYQDTNLLQEKIIQLLKKTGKNNLFMVGDVKQSIYSFRQAEPQLFLQKYHDFASNDNDAKRILLSDNFRSTKPVVDSVNKVFNGILTKDFGGIDYEQEGQLVFGASYYPDELDNASELIYHEKVTANHKKTAAEATKNVETGSYNIDMVIARIKQFEKEKLQVFDPKLGHKRPFRYSDIAILVRSHTRNVEIMQKFAASNLPLYVTDAQNYFQTFELTVIMDYLKIIDNPDQDIPLVTVLRSPLFNFKEKDLAQIRIHSKKASFYNALTAYVVVNDELSTRIKAFLNQLAALRQFAVTHRISELIWSIYERTNLLEIMTTLPNGEQRRVNLEALYERASSFESAGFKGLYQFINFIERIRRSEKDLAQPLLTKEAGNSVKLMTVHGAKGLEFPIVFCLEMEHSFQKRDVQNNYLITNRNLGLNLRQEDYRVDSLVKAIDNVQKNQQLLEEEARILYVELTRAKQKLILVSDIPSFVKNTAKWPQQLDASGHLPLTDKLSATMPLSFIGPVLDFTNNISQKISEITDALDQKAAVLYLKYEDEDNSTEKVAAKATKADENTNKTLIEAVKKLYSFTYPFSDASQTTAYQAVSEIKKAFNDPLESELKNSHLLSSTNRYLQPIDTKPNFLFESKFTGAEIGTATHLILQYYDYSGPGNKQQLDDEIQTLVKQQKLNPQIVPSINKDHINWFVHSTFAKKFWQQPDKLKREIDFSSLLPAQEIFSDFSDPAAKILVHGTIDGYFIDDDGIRLFDYKTDHVAKNQQAEAIAQIKQKYQGQLRLYEQALNGFAKVKVKNKYLILLDVEQVVEIN